MAYLGNNLQNKLTDIVQSEVQTFATDNPSQVRFIVQDYGGQDYLYFADDKGNKKLYEKVGEQGNGIIAKENNDQNIINAFENAIQWGITETVIVQQLQVQPDTSELQNQVAEQIQEQVVLPPIVQPIVYNEVAQVPIQWATSNNEPAFIEQPTPAEKWVIQNIAIPVQSKGITVYNDNIPQNTVRPDTYVVIIVDEEIRDIYFAGNKNINEESLITIIIQGHNTTFDNWVVECSNYIQDLLRDFRAKGIVRNITNRNIGYDEEKQITTRTITFFYKY
jgi:hypothetical protein